MAVADIVDTGVYGAVFCMILCAAARELCLFGRSVRRRWERVLSCDCEHCSFFCGLAVTVAVADCL